MENVIPLSDVGTIGILLSAIGGLWAWHIKTVNKKDQQINDSTKRTEKLLDRSIDVIDRNTKAIEKHTQTLEQSTTQSAELHRSLTDYVIHAAGKK